MSNDTDVLDCYRRMLRQMLDMVSQAYDNEWDRLVRTQRDYVAGVDKLAACEHTIALDATGRRYKQQLINQIFEAEQIVRERLTVRMDELSGLMKQAHQSRQVKTPMQPRPPYSAKAVLMVSTAPRSENW